MAKKMPYARRDIFLCVLKIIKKKQLYVWNEKEKMLDTRFQNEKGKN